MKRTVHIVDDDDGVRKSLRLLMSSVQLEAETYASARAFLDRMGDLDDAAAHCLILDVRMPEMNGLELQEELRRRNCRHPVILLSGFGDVPMAVRAMNAGARTFLEKSCDEQHLIDQVFAALKSTRGSDGARNTLARYREQLTMRQADVFDLLVQGLQSKPIAEHLGISSRTVEAHRAKILRRLNATSFAQLLSQALQTDPPR